MESITITLPDSGVRAHVDNVLASGTFRDASEYILALIQEDRRRREKARLETLLLEGLEGEATPLTDADWDAMRRQYDERHRVNGGV